jgi:signal transduction histidine kinase
MAVLVLVITGILQVVTNFGMLYNYVLNEHGMMIASLLEITIIAVGLFYNVYAENKLKRNRVLQLEMQQSDTLKKLLTIQDTEQKRIANDLHDNIGPLLASLKINFGRILFTSDVSNQQELVVKTEAIINEAIAEIRNIAHDLMPKGLSSKGLIASLNDYAMSIGKLYRKTVQFQHSITNTIPPEKQLHIYRIICELVLNAAKHSTGNLVEITITDKSDGLHIMIFDNGKGFNKEEDLTKSFGLKSAESRISYLRGNLQLESIPGKGTKLMFNIPSTL